MHEEEVIEVEPIEEPIIEIPVIDPDLGESTSGATTEPIKYFTYGNMTMDCSCGNQEVIEYAIKDGIQFVFRTSEQDVFGLVCSKCKHSMKLFYKESSIEEIENKYGIIEPVSEDSNTEEVNMGVSTDNELSVETNA